MRCSFSKTFIVAVAVAVLPHLPARAADALPSWNDGAAKRAIVAFVEKVAKPGTPDFVEPAKRIAVFDNDGTLWSEQPMYVQLAFLFDRVRALAPQHPEWKDKQPYKAALEGDLKALGETGMRGLTELTAATHAGMSAEEFEEIVTQWLATARHPKFDRPYTELVYQPMLELMSYLRYNGFKTFIVSGGGIDFIRPWAEKTYGIPPEQVVGSSIEVKYETKDGESTLVRLPELRFVDDKAGKPVGIHFHIGRRPIAAFGNSDGDLEMLAYTTAGSGLRFGLLVRHDDSEREYAYDRDSLFGKLDKALDEAKARGWTVVDMKRDWKTVFPPEQGALR
ncbi:HAD family hydrolase [Hyphomicrobium sp. NDB2Meth4]|uniref:HAD family hydrolase n=1 Tax=Hyphomicrobium sp. NDB2Meth4 TaxID=1892846 RepID=UPI0009316206|nr:HAD family hydrolase [Hyphomicrobium sp. NDB2Meth4]